jgi:hypothetical protein
MRTNDIIPAQFIEILRRECIDGQALLAYTPQEMKEDGFPRGIAKKLITGIRNLAQGHVSSNTSRIQHLEDLVKELNLQLLGHAMQLNNSSGNLALGARKKLIKRRMFSWHANDRHPLLLPMGNGQIIYGIDIPDAANNSVGWKTILGDVAFSRGTFYWELVVGRCGSGSFLFGVVPDTYSKYEGGISTGSPGVTLYPFFQKPDNLRVKGNPKERSYGISDGKFDTAGHDSRIGMKVCMDTHRVQFFRNGERAGDIIHCPLALSGPMRPAASLFYPGDNISLGFESYLKDEKFAFLMGVFGDRKRCPLHQVLGKNALMDENIILNIFQFLDVFQEPTVFS